MFPRRAAGYFGLSWVMAEKFTLTVDYKNTERIFEAELRVYGYTYKIAMQVDDTEILFERDEEGNFRALLPEADKQKMPDRHLLQLITEELERLLK